MGCGPSNFLQNIKKGSHIEINVDANNATADKSEKSRKTVKLQDAHQTKVHPQKLPLESLTRKKTHISVLLVFKRNNSQCLAFSRAAEKLKYSCRVVCDVRDLEESYGRSSPDVVVVDSRPGCGVCPEECSKLIRSLENGRQSVLVAVRSQILTDSDSEKMMQLIEAGFDRQFLENTNPVVCLSELQTLHHSHVHSLSYENKCRMFLDIIDNVSDAVEIMDPDYKIQYVNSSSELLYGLEAEDVEGHSYWEKLAKAPDSKMSKWLSDSPQVHSMLMPILRKNGEQIQQMVSFLPILGRSGCLEHLVAVHSSSTQRGRSSELVTTPTNEIKSKSRKESVIRLPSMSIEAPITKVINMITTLQDACSDDVSDSLNNILDVLRSSELYAPYFSERVRGDKFTCELVGGLMTRDKDEWNNRRVSLGKRPSYSSDQPLLPKSSFHSVNHSQGALFPEIEALLESEENWDFDIIGLERLTNKKPLFHLAMRTFQRFEVTDFLQVEDSILASWLQMIECNYHQTNPYHNSTHAADVMHASAYFLSCEQIKAIFDHVDEVACLIAAVVHDLDHPGKTNSFLVNSNADLAFLYNDLAVLESHHVSLAFRLTLKNEETNIFKNISREDFKLLRQQIIDMVLATEMTKHFEHLNRFVSVVNQASVCESPGCNNRSKQNDTPGFAANVNFNDALLKLATVENKILVKRMLIKCADVSNPARPLYLCKEWAVRIAKEYCDQTDEEKSRGLPVVMPVFDSKSCNVPKSQTSFVDLFISDMYESWTNFCSLPEMKVILRDNYQFWKDQELCITQDF